MSDMPQTGDPLFDHDRMLVASAPDPMFTLDRRGEFLFVNKAGARMLGLATDEIVGKLIRDLFPSELSDKMHASVEEVFRTGEPLVASNLQMATVRGQTWVNTILTPVKGPGGEVECVLGVSRDVTALKETEEQLRLSREGLSAIVDRTADGILLIDTDTVVRYANPAARTFLERPRTPLEGRAFELPIELDATATIEIRRGIADLGTGEMAVVSSTWEGEPAYLVMIRDITERHRAEIVSARNEELLMAALESTTDGILVVDMAGHATHSNAMFASMWGIPGHLIEEGSVEPMLGFVASQLVDPDGFRAKIDDDLPSASEQVDLIRFKDGRVFERISRPLMRGLRVRGRLVRFRDVTPTGGDGSSP